MCGRFFVDAKNREIDRLRAMLPENAPMPKTGEVYPTENAIILTGGNNVQSMAWGFPRRDDKGVIFNARSESALQKPMFARALRTHPAAIPASGFMNGIPQDKEPERTNIFLQILIILSFTWPVSGIFSATRPILAILPF